MAKRRDDVGPQRPPKRLSASREADERDIGAALRNAYQKTVEEAVPDDLLDLLGKLS